MIDLENEYLKIVFDERGRICQFYSRLNQREFLTIPGAVDNWRIALQVDCRTMITIPGRDQIPDHWRQSDDRVSFHYSQLRNKAHGYDIDLGFHVSLVDEEARFWIDVGNHCQDRIREVWAPIFCGFEGYNTGDQKNQVDFAKTFINAKDILHTGLPRAKNAFFIDGEVAEYPYWPLFELMQWWDLYSLDEGIYISSDDKRLNLTVFRLEKYPAERGSGNERAVFPADTPRWLNFSVGKLTTIDPGEEWEMPETVIWPHRGDWHTGADHYRNWALSWMRFPELPDHFKYYTGWHNLIGKTYLNEVYHTFESLAELVVDGQKRTGVSTLQLYGHSEIGCEGANYFLKPGSNLGGPDGFQRMCQTLHQNGIKVIVFTHRQGAVAIDRPTEYKPYESWVIRDRNGKIRKEAWWKTTLESLTTYIENPSGLVFYEGTGPIWTRVCPYCDLWWETFLDEVIGLARLGCDGIQMDTFGAEGGTCYATEHGHKAGEWTMAKLGERIAWLVENVHQSFPDFIFCTESLGDYFAQYCTLPYSRYRQHQGLEVFKYTFPEIRQMVAVSAYSYDQVAKGFLLGYGFNLEVEGLKKTILIAPEFADYIGEVNRIRMKYRDYLLNGRFLDTLRAKVSGKIRYGVHQGPKGLAATFWNPEVTPQEVELEFDEAEALEYGVLCIPGQEEKEVQIPCRFQVEPHGLAAVIAESRRMYGQ